jgi:hypothetical protein
LQYCTDVLLFALFQIIKQLITQNILRSQKNITLFQTAKVLRDSRQNGYQELSEDDWLKDLKSYNGGEDITLCSLLKVTSCFSACYLSHDGFLLGLFVDPEDGCNMFL